MKKIKKILFIAFVLFIGLAGVARADTNIHLTIKTNNGNIYDQDISVSACNSDNGATSNLTTTAYCAVMQTGLPSNWNWAWPPGAFLNSFNNIAGYTSQDSSLNNVYHYWSWSVNGTGGATGLNEYTLFPNDLITITFVDPIDPSSAIQIFSGGTTSPVKENKIKPVFDIKKALDFLSSKQKNNGPFGDLPASLREALPAGDLYTDWATLAFAGNDDYQIEKSKLENYYFTEKIYDGSLTDYERHSMALMALGLDPYNTNGENYIEKITTSFDGKQFGDPFEDNDDIFALIVLQNAGFTKDENIIDNTINFILSKQKKDGSWDENVDMTGAAIESLSNYKDSSSVQIALEKGEAYLKKELRDNGSFNENVSSTTWALEGILSLGEKPEDWQKNNNSPLDYLALNQDLDGGIREADINSKIWETAYATSAIEGKTWNQIMQKFDPIRNRPSVASATVTLGQPASNGTKIKNITKKIVPLPANEAIVTPTKPQKKSWFIRFLNNIFWF